MKHRFLLFLGLFVILATPTLDAQDVDIRIYPLSRDSIAILNRGYTSKLSILNSQTFEPIRQHKLLCVSDFNYLPQKGLLFANCGPWKNYNWVEESGGPPIDKSILINPRTGEETHLSEGRATNARINSAESLVLYYATRYSGKGDLISVADIESGALKFRLAPQNPYGVTANDIDFTRFVPNSDQFLTFGPNVDFSLWDVSSGKRVKVIRKKTIVFEVAFDQQGKYALAARASGGILLYDAKTWKLIRRFKHFSADAKDVQILPSGKLAMGSLWDTVRFWEVPSGKLVRTIRLKQRIHRLKYDPFQDRIFIASGDDLQISVWSTKGKKLKQFTLN